VAGHDTSVIISDNIICKKS